ncbi:MAG: PAS domain-containing protein, partial [Planctomycetota bacterium]
KSTNGLLGKHISSFHTEEEMEVLVADFIEEAKRRGQFAGPVEHMRNDGTVFPTQTRMITVKVDEGKAVGLVIFASDASGHSHTQHHLSQQTMELAAANEQLQSELAKQKQNEDCPKEQLEELMAANEKLEHQMTEYAQAEDNLKQRNNQLEQQAAELTKTREQLEQALAEHKQAEKYLKQQIAEVKIRKEQGRKES